MKSACLVVALCVAFALANPLEKRDTRLVERGQMGDFSIGEYFSDGYIVHV